MVNRPVLLIILDGLGLNPSRACNGWALARTPHLDHYFASWPHTALQASGEAVGLPDGQFGNSEVGHLTLGAGRVLEQNLLRIKDAIANGSLSNHPAWHDMIQRSRQLHLVGMIRWGRAFPYRPSLWPAAADCAGRCRPGHPYGHRWPRHCTPYRPALPDVY